MKFQKSPNLVKLKIKLPIYGCGSDRSANYATTTDQPTGMAKKLRQTTKSKNNFFSLRLDKLWKGNNVQGILNFFVKFAMTFEYEWIAMPKSL